MMHGVSSSKKLISRKWTDRVRAWDPRYYNFCALRLLAVIVWTPHNDMYFVDILVGRLDIRLREQQTTKWKLLKTIGNYC